MCVKRQAKQNRLSDFLKDVESTVVYLIYIISYYIVSFYDWVNSLYLYSSFFLNVHCVLTFFFKLIGCSAGRRLTFPHPATLLTYKHSTPLTTFVYVIIIEPAHDKTYNKTYVTSKDSDLPAYPRSLIRVFADPLCLLQSPGYSKRDKLERLPYMGGCAGWSLLVTQVLL